MFSRRSRRFDAESTSAMKSSFLTDPNVWSAAIALLALFLSQLPPLKDIFSGTRVKLSLTDRFTVGHYLGNLFILSLVTFENQGTRKVTIQKLHGLLIDSSGNVQPMPGQQYILPPTKSGENPPELLFAGLSLKADERWSETVRFFRSFSEDEEDKVNDLASKMRKDISKKPPAAGPPWPEVDPQLVTEAVDFFGRQFRLTKGNYQFIIAAASEKEEILAVQGVEFTIYENSVAALKSATEDYKFGAGVYYPSSNPSIYIYPRLRQLPPEQAQKIFEKKFSA
jgi:hypothetical protein